MFLQFGCGETAKSSFFIRGVLAFMQVCGYNMADIIFVSRTIWRETL
jgi:hypothetical protein